MKQFKRLAVCKDFMYELSAAMGAFFAVPFLVMYLLGLVDISLLF